MKTHRTSIPGLALALGGFAVFTTALQAAPFVYSPGDLVVTFRKSGGASDLVVNIGKATNYNNVPLGTSFTVTNVVVSQLDAAFASFNSLSWSVSAANRPPIDENYPIQTIWTTSPRSDASANAPALLRKGQYVQGTAASQIDAIGNNAASYSSSVSSNANNTTVGVVISSSSDYALKPVLGDGNLAGTFQAFIEATTTNTFASSSTNVSRADLYELIPGSFSSDTSGRYLGYFEFKPDGSLTFNNVLAPPSAPTITDVSQSAGVVTITFTTEANATYRLRHATANALTNSIATWDIGDSVAGDGSPKTLQFTASDASGFFVVEAAR